ncbi:MAG: AtpZ/AtpI family protein [Rhodospirillaceae bacterium]|nr:AtpZ/AtpI family protein [Rhodospirillaceae bacterium]
MTEGHSKETPTKTGDEDARSLEDLGKRLNKARARGDRAAGRFTKVSGNPTSGVAMAMRIGVELVAAFGVGFGVGWYLDKTFDTKPWFMLVFMLLGASAGLLNTYRVVRGYGPAAGYKKPVETSGEDQES